MQAYVPLPEHIVCNMQIAAPQVMCSAGFNCVLISLTGVFIRSALELHLPDAPSWTTLELLRTILLAC